MDPVERIKGDGKVVHAYVRRERLERLQAKGRFPGRRGGGRAPPGGVDDESEYKSQPHMDMEMEVEYQTEDDVEKEMGDDDEHQQRWRRVPEPEPDHLDDYPGGPHDTTMLTRYYVHMAKMAADGEVRHYYIC